MSIRAALYARQSVDLTEGVERQIARCHGLAQSRDYEVVAELRDNDASAFSGKARTDWQRLLALLDAGDIDVVVAVNLDRLLRSVGDLAQLLDRGALVLTVEGDLDLTTADGEFRATLLASLARFEILRKSERQTRANEAKHQAGKVLPGRRRYGYRAGNKEADPDEAAVVRRMFADLLAGKSIRGIAAALNEDGLLPTTGSAQAWSPRRVRETLLNPSYAGFVLRRGVRVPSEEAEALIDLATFEEATAILANEQRRTTPGPKHKHWLSGVALCGTCEQPLHFMRGYICRGGKGGHPYIGRDKLEPYVLADLSRTLLASAADLLRHDGTNKTAPLIAEREANLRAVAQVIDDRDEGLIPPDMARAKLLELRTAREALESKLDEARLASSAGEQLEALAREVLTGDDGEVIPMARFAEAQRTVEDAFQALPIEDRKKITRSLLEIRVYPGRDTAKRVQITHPRTPWLDAADDAERDLWRQVE